MTALTTLGSLACVLLCAAGAVSSARAGVSSSATLGPITIEAIDLDPSDGIAPWFAFMENPSWSVLQTVERWRGDPSIGTSATRLLFGGSDCTLARADAVVAAQTSLAVCNEQPLPDPALTAAGRAQSFDSVLAGDAAGYGATARTFYARDYNSGYFSWPIAIIVSPMTAIVVSADAAISVHGGDDGTAQARAWLGLRANALDRDGPVVSLAYATTLAPGSIDSFVGGRRLVVRFDNTDPDGSRLPGLDAGVHVQGLVHAHVVPEPATGALLLAGLGWLWGGAKRRPLSASARSTRPA